MRALRRGTSAGGLLLAAALVAATVPGGAASAASSSTTFANASFNGYSSGEIVHLNALQLSTAADSIADVEEGYSSGSVNTAGLANALVGDSQDGSLTDQPALSTAKKAYGSGAGAAVGLDTTAPTDSQVSLAGLASQNATPNNGEVSKSLPSAAGLDLPSGLLSAKALTGRADATFSTDVCPLGQPLSYGLGDAAEASALNLADLTGTSTVTSGLAPVITLLNGLLGNFGVTIPSTSSAGTVLKNDGDTRTVADTYLSANGNGTFGLTSQETETVAPVVLNLLGLAKVKILVGGTITNGSVTQSPITLTSTATGLANGAETRLTDNDVVEVELVVDNMDVTLVPATSLNTILGEDGLSVPLSLGTVLDPILTAANVPSSVTSALSTVLDASLGSLDIGTPVRAINGSATSAPTPPGGTASSSEGTTASGAFDLVHVDLAPMIPKSSALKTLLSTLGGLLKTLGLGSLPTLPTVPGAGSTTILLDANVGHMETEANLKSAITCNIPVIKSANPTAVKAGDSFVYTIDVPNPADIPLLDCNLDDISAIDTISDSKGDPSFTVTGVSSGGSVVQTTPTSATVTWKGLDYKVAPVGASPNPPIQLTIDVKVPAGSPSGVVQDLVTASGTLGTCNGGASGQTGLGNGTGTALTGQYSLTQPSVTAVATTTPPVTTTTPGNVSTPENTGNPQLTSLPRTGGTGGLWQPGLGVLALGLGGGTLTLLRRSRRRRP